MPGNDAPLGGCGKCGMGMIRREGVSVCPNCSSKTGTRSGLVNKFQDPGKNMSPDGTLMGKPQGGIVKQDGEVTMGYACVTNTVHVDLANIEPVDEVGDLVDRIDNLLANMRLSDFSDLREARKVMKYRKKLATLKLELQDFLG